MEAKIIQFRAGNWQRVQNAVRRGWIIVQGWTTTNIGYVMVERKRV